MPVKKDYLGTGGTLEAALVEAVQALRKDQGKMIKYVLKQVQGDTGNFAPPRITVIITAQGKVPLTE